MGQINRAITDAGNVFTRKDVGDLRKDNFSAKQIDRVRRGAENTTDRAKTVIDDLLEKAKEKADPKTNTGPSNFSNPNNPSSNLTAYNFDPSALRFGLTPQLGGNLILPKDITKLSVQEQADVRSNLAESIKLNNESYLTELRGRISKELAQLYNMTEIGKSKIAAQSAMDTTRETGMQSFRQNLRQGYASSLMNFM